MFTKLLNISKNIDIRFDTAVTDFNTLEYDYLIINTRFKEVKIDHNRVFLIDYTLKKDSNKHFAGNSLLQAIYKMDKIIQQIENDYKKTI